MKKSVFYLKDSYLAFIKNSVGSKSFRNSFFEVNGRKQDILKNGDLSCAFFVSSVLKIFDLISPASSPHATVKGTINDMLKNGWREISKAKPGSVLIWENKNDGISGNQHIGFYLGGNRAVPNNHRRKSPDFHDCRKDKITHIFWHSKLES